MKLEKRSSFGWGATPAGHADIRNGMVAHYDGSNQGLADKSHTACRRYWVNTRSFHINTRGWLDIGYCVDEETEILTEDGWKTFRDVRPGDIALTLDHESSLSEWQPIEDVYVFPARPREMIRMEGSSHSSLTTADHRWPIERFYRRTGTTRQKQADGKWAPTGRSSRTEQGRERRWATTDTLTVWDRIPIAAPCAELPAEPKWSDGFVEALAWFWTEGHIKPQSRSRQPSTGVVIYQSALKNPANVARMRAALHEAFGPPVASFPRQGRGHDGEPRWREAANRDLAEFHLSVAAGRALLEQAPGRVPRRDFLRSLTRAQLDLFIEVSLLADGSNSRTNNSRQLCQKNREAAEAFQYAAILAGHATSLRRKPPTSTAACEMWAVNLRTRTHFGPRAAASSGKTFKIAREDYTGHIWCVRTPNSTWLARRAGTVYFTGNSFGVCPHGIVLEGRGLNRVQAAQPGGNSTWYSCTFMSGPAERPTSAQLQAWRELRSWLRGKGVASAVKGHREFVSTDCPGPIIWSMVRDGTLRQPPSTEPPEEETLKILTSLATSGTVTLEPGQRQDLSFAREFDDPGGLHSSGSTIAPKESAFHHISLAVRISGLPAGQHVKVSWAQHEKGGTHVRDMFGETKLGVNGTSEFQLTAMENLSKDLTYRAALTNRSEKPITLEAAYLKIGR